jgi:predicted RNA-binding Zn ribbon-like protein
VRDNPSPHLAGRPQIAQRLELCLDFANTVDWHCSDRPQETLHTYEDFLTWAAAQKVISQRQVDALAARARREPQAAVAAYRRATALREAVYRIFVARIGGKTPARADVSVDATVWRLSGDDAELDLPLWPMVQSAAELVLSDNFRDRVGQCADPAGCGWLFLDLSKNHSRRWCSIRDCGNRAKQRRLQARLKQSG